MFLLLALTLVLGVNNASAQTPLAPGTAPVGQATRPQQDTRNIRVENKDARKDINTERRGDVKEINKEAKEKMMDLKDEKKDMIKNASSTADRKAIKSEFKGKRDESLKTMKLDKFNVRKSALSEKLTLTLSNLTSIRARISAKIAELKSSGKDVTVAEAALVTANADLAKAKASVEAFVALKITAPTASTTSTGTEDVKLTEPRKLGDIAIKDLRAAQQSYKKVYNALKPLMPKPEGDKMSEGAKRPEGANKRSASTTAPVTTTNTITQ